jgi:hypothetical protein
VRAQLHIEEVPHLLGNEILNSEIRGSQVHEIPLLVVDVVGLLQVEHHNEEEDCREASNR